MNQKTLTFLMKLVAFSVQAKSGGLTDELQAQAKALAAEANDSILEPKDDGTPWTAQDILDLLGVHNDLTAQIRDRHDGD